MALHFITTEDLKERIAKALDATLELAAELLVTEGEANAAEIITALRRLVTEQLEEQS